MFDTLKGRVTAEPVLAHTVLNDQFELEVDASGYAVGVVLLQRKEDNKKHPIGYYSTMLNEAQQNYVLAGSPHKIIIYSDHLNLQYWRLPQRISRRVAREVLELSEYNFEICQFPGKLNRRVDTLSRRLGYNQGEDDNRNMTILPDHVFVRATGTEQAPPMQ